MRHKTSSTSKRSQQNNGNKLTKGLIGELSAAERAERHWTAKRTEFLIERWNAGWTTFRLEVYLGVSRSSISGKVDRLRYSGVNMRVGGHVRRRTKAVKERRAKSNLAEQAEQVEAVDRKAAEPPSRRRRRHEAGKPAPAAPPARLAVAAPAPPQPDPADPPAGITNILDLTDGHCRWIDGNPALGLGKFAWCGCRVVPGSRWCEVHLRRVYQPPLPRRQPTPAAEPVAELIKTELEKEPTS